MKLLAAVFGGFSAVAALVAAWLWWKASIVAIEAPAGSGVGGLLGGGLVVMMNGKKVDLHKTLEQQSLWNSRAARAAALSGVLAALASVSSYFSG